MAVVREDVVKLSFEFDNKQMNKADKAVDDLVEKTQDLGGPKGTGKAEEGFEDAAKAAKKFGETKLDRLSDGIDRIVAGVGKFALGAGKTAFKGLATAAAAGTTALAALGTAAINSYAEFEQLKGGVDTLFGNGGQSYEEFAASVGKSTAEIKAFQKANGLAVDGIIGPQTTAALQKQYAAMADVPKKVLANANDAFRTAGMDANTYMSTITSFSASLISSLGGDTAKAADYADRAIIDMADNANKMGTDISMIQNAYQGFAKQNYTMLDNLKLGYGGTQEEMKRLIKDAAAMKDVQEKLGITVDANSMSFANVVNAISVMQAEMGIAGATADEAAETISGSANAMKAAWSNFLTGMANDEADFDQLLNNLIDSVQVFLKNIIPRIKKMLPRLVRGLTEITKTIGKELPGILEDLLPALIDGGIDLVGSLYDVIVSNTGMFKNIGLSIIGMIYKGFTGKEMPTDMFETLKTKLDEISTAAAKIVEGFANFGQQLWVALGPALLFIVDLALDAFVWIGDNINWLLPILGSLLGAMLAFKAVKSVTSIISGFKGALGGILGLFGKGGGAASAAGGAGGGTGAAGGAFGIKNVASAMGGIATAIFGVGLIIAAFALLKKIPGYDEFMADGGAALKQLVGIIEDIGLVGAAFVSFVAVVGNFSSVAAAGEGILIIAEVLAGMEAVVLAFGAIAQIPGIDKFMNEGGQMLVDLCRIIGEMAGSIIGGIGEGISNSLPAIGDNISAFATSLEPAIATFSGMDFDGLKSFAAAFGEFILVMTGEKIASWFTGGIDYAQIGTDLTALATNGAGFFTAMEGISDTAFANATKLFECLNGIGLLPGSGGVKQWFTGEVNYQGIADGIAALAGAGMISALNAISGIPETAFTALTNMFTALAGIKEMPQEGGIASWFAGEQSTALSSVAAALPGVATDIAAFFVNLGGRTDFAPIKDLFETLGNINIDADAASKGFLGLGTSDFEALGTGLSSFATNAAPFFSAVDASNPEKMVQFFNALGMAGGLPEALSEIDTNVGTTLAGMLTTINGYYTKLFTSGQMIMKGLNAGLLSMKSSLLATARSIANEISRTIDKAFDVNSPSRVTFETGTYVGMGLDEGMRSMIPDLQVTARDVSTASLPFERYSPESSTSYYSSNSGGDITTVSPVFNLTISGTQDDRATARRVKRYVAEAIKETFESLERKSYAVREV